MEDEAGLLEGLTIVMEPGRRIAGDAGVLLTRVCNIKQRPETGDTWLDLPQPDLNFFPLPPPRT